MIKNAVLMPFLIALSLLTRLPVSYLFRCVGLTDGWTNKHQGLSPLYYPVVGLLLACLLYGVFILLPWSLSSIVVAVLIVIAWVVLTGALHLDGLADSIDAAFFSHHIVTDQQQDEVTRHETIARILSVFKDPAAGPMAVVALVLTVLLKTVLLYELVENLTEQLWVVLIISLALSRALALMLMASTPYVSTNGLGSALVGYLPKHLAFIVMLLVMLACFSLLPFVVTVYLLCALGLLFFLWRRFWLRRIGGFVGDCIGALIEMAELLILLILCLAFL